MSLFHVKTHDLSWQDRTINIEMMMAPARSQLLYNKHKGLKTKCQQENYNLDRERDSYLKSYKTDIRLMERRKELYSKRRNDIILKRSIAENRRRASVSGPPGRISAPPRLERTTSFTSTSDPTFITQLQTRESQSAGEQRQPSDQGKSVFTTPEMTKLPEVTKTQVLATETPDLRTISPCMSTRSPSPGKPYLLRNKSVRFLVSQTCPKKTTLEPLDLPVDERIKRFLATQVEFNKTGPTSIFGLTRKLKSSNLPVKQGNLGVNMLKLEAAFDDFIQDNSDEGLQKLVRYATRVKATARNARNSAIMPRRMSLLATL